MTLHYSRNDEDFIYDSLDSLFDDLYSDDELTVGIPYYEVETVPAEPSDFLNADRILDDADEVGYAEHGESWNNEFGDVDAAAKKELQELLNSWFERHINIGYFTKIVGESKRSFVTKSDVDNFNQTMKIVARNANNPE